MKEINKTFLIFLLLFTFLTVSAETKTLKIGNADATVTIKVFSSLTCPHCANFHIKIFNNLKKDFIDKGLVKFEHHAFPLDLAALNAEVIVRCQNKNTKKFELLEQIYKDQKKWAIGSDINEINLLIKKIGLNFNLTDDNMNKCLKDSKSQDQILNERIDAQKKYKIESTPTIFINEKKYLGKVDYDSFKKMVEKNL